MSKTTPVPKEQSDQKAISKLHHTFQKAHQLVLVHALSFGRVKKLNF